MKLFGLWGKKGKTAEKPAFNLEKIMRNKIIVTQTMRDETKDKVLLFADTEIDGKDYLVKMKQYEYETRRQFGDPHVSTTKMDCKSTQISVFDLRTGEETVAAEVVREKLQDEKEWNDESRVLLSVLSGGKRVNISGFSNQKGWDAFADCIHLSGYERMDGQFQAYPVKISSLTAQKLKLMVGENPQVKTLYADVQKAEAGSRSAARPAQNSGR